ncbi:hypothetical protein P9112_014337 [Eukaryota sp. TZLM1-RC]
MQLEELVGLSGKVPSGILCIPNSDHYIYTISAHLICRSTSDRNFKQVLRGHSGDITCFSLSPSGRYLVSGQQTHAGFVADIIVWDLEDFSIVQRLSLHKVRVESVVFSHDGNYIASLGGPDDNLIALWEFTSSDISAVASSSLGRFTQTIVKPLSSTDKIEFLTVGVEQALVWTFNNEARRFTSEPVSMGSIRRSIISLDILGDDTGDVAFAGTSSGDLLEISLSSMRLKASGPVKSLLQGGVTSCVALNRDEVVVGTGEGTVAVLKKVEKKVGRNTVSSFVVEKQVKIVGGVFGICKTGLTDQDFLVTTCESNFYLISLNDQIESTLISTAHPVPITTCSFPSILPDYGLVFLSAGGPDVRLWTNILEKPANHGQGKSRTVKNRQGSREVTRKAQVVTPLLKERLRICCPGVDVLSAAISPNGDVIVSGWSDGNVRGFAPESGKLLFSIQNAHKAEIMVGKHSKPGGVTSLLVTDDYIITAGVDSLIRIWKFSNSPQLIHSFKEHRSVVNSLKLEQNILCSASEDGSIVLIDLDEMKRMGSLTAPTAFSDLAVTSDATQIVTVSFDCLVRYWDAVTFEELRQVEMDGELTCLAISSDDSTLAIGHRSGHVCVLDYDTSEVEGEFDCLSKAVSGLSFTHNKSHLIASGLDGGLALLKL